MSRNVLKGQALVCKSGPDCKRAAARADAQFAEGQLSHVGLHYDMFESGVPWRVVVVGLEVGRPDEHVSLAARRRALFTSAHTPFRDRNPHMVGTTSALRLAFGRLPGDDPAGELLKLKQESKPQHLFECFALLNKRLCSAVVKTSERSGRRYRAAAVPAMDRACLRHLLKSIEILEPSLVVLQSMGLRKLIDNDFKKPRLIQRKVKEVEYGTLAGIETMVASFSHPAAYGPLNWGNSAYDAYLSTTVEPAITEARGFWFGR